MAREAKDASSKSDKLQEIKSGFASLRTFATPSRSNSTPATTTASTSNSGSTTSSNTSYPTATSTSTSYSTTASASTSYPTTTTNTSYYTSASTTYPTTASTSYYPTTTYPSATAVAAATTKATKTTKTTKSKSLPPTPPPRFSRISLSSFSPKEIAAKISSLSKLSRKDLYAKVVSLPQQLHQQDVRRFAIGLLLCLVYVGYGIVHSLVVDTGMLLGTVTPVNTTGCAPIRFAGSVWGTLTGEGGQPLQACEDVHLHRRSGLVFTACGVAESRKTWFPAAGKFEATSPKIEEEGWLRDELVVYDVAQAGVARAVNIIGFPADVDRVFVGMDVYEDPSVELALSQKRKVKNHKLTLFLINQRRTGSVVEVLEYTFNDKKTRYIETIQHKLVWAPNDILAMGPRSFYVTNDHYYTKGVMRSLEEILRRPWSNVVYVSPSETFVAYSGIVSANGITANTDRSLIFVSAIHGAALHVLRTRSPLALSPPSPSSSSDDDETEGKVVKKQSLRTHPNRLVSVDYIKLDFYSDNPSFDPETNSIFVAGHVQPRKLIAGLNTPEVPVQGPSRVVKISPRFKDDEEARKSQILPSFLGLNRYYNVEKVLEDDGSDISTATTAVVDRQRKVIVIGAAFSEKGLLRCPIPEGL